MISGYHLALGTADWGAILYARAHAEFQVTGIEGLSSRGCFPFARIFVFFEDAVAIRRGVLGVLFLVSPPCSCRALAVCCGPWLLCVGSLWVALPSSRGIWCRVWGFNTSLGIVGSDDGGYELVPRSTTPKADLSITKEASIVLGIEVKLNMYRRRAR